jgi:predicted DNA-binding protein (MmcQ/YjbR family)
MTLENICAICKNFKGVTEDIKWENHLCFNVGGKMFLVTSPDTVPISASFKVNDDEFEILSSREGFMPAPYLARYKWVRIDDINLLSKKQWEFYIQESYMLIASRLPEKIKKQLGL